MQAGPPVLIEEDDEGDTRPWRCLDANHEAGCRRCTPPPLENGAWVLRSGRPRMQSGEKQLRSALCRTPEWRSADARETAAVAFDASGATSTALALRKRECSALRKLDMLRLCHKWRYASNVWQPLSCPPTDETHATGALPARRRRLPRTAKATMAHVQAMAAPQAPPATLGSGTYFIQLTQVRWRISFVCCVQFVARSLTPCSAAVPIRLIQLDSIAIFVVSTLAPAQAHFLAHEATPALFAAGAAEQEAPTLVHARGSAALASALARIASAFDADLVRVQAAAAAQAGALLPGTWPAAAATPPLAETALHALLLLAHGRAAYLADVTSPVHGVAARHRRGLSGPERAHVGDVTAADAALRRFLAAAASLLARCREEDVQSYLAASVEVLGLAASAARGAAASAARHAAWARGRECSWPKPLLRYIVTASMPAAAAAAMAEAQASEAADSAAAEQAAAAAADEAAAAAAATVGGAAIML